MILRNYLLKKPRRALLFGLLMLPIVTKSQEYVNIFSINCGENKKTSTLNNSNSTAIKTFEANLTLPIEINDKLVILTGINFDSNVLQLFPNQNYNNLYATRIKLGAKINHSEKWSGTYLILPKIASDYVNITDHDYYLGGLLLWKYTKNKKKNFKIGMYASSEAFGLFISPIIGLYYLSPNNRFETNVAFPGEFDLNYGFTKATKIGLDYTARGNSYRQTHKGLPDFYVQNNSLEFATYIQNTSLYKNILLRLKMGISNNKFEAYSVNQKIELQLANFKFGDSRTLLNDNLKSSLFLKLEAIYRFNFVPKK